jgi:hypothetical protein
VDSCGSASQATKATVSDDNLVLLLQAVTCSYGSLISKVTENHLQHGTINYEEILSPHVRTAARALQSGVEKCASVVRARQILSYIDPRCKDLEDAPVAVVHDMV